MSGKIKLDISIADYPHTHRLLTGDVEIEGIEPHFIAVVPQIGAFRRMVRNLEFDVCELAPTTYIVARAYGIPIIALPIFVMRRFHHSGLLVRSDAGIEVPRDLEGKKVGVRAYSVTTGVWTRAILVEEFGLDAEKVTWVVDDEEHVTQMPLPPNVEQADGHRSLYDMMKAGDLAAGFAANAGVGRTGAPTGGWQVVKTDWPDLLPSATEIEAEWHRRTRIYPMHGTIVVKESVLADHPWVTRSLFDAFSQAKSDWLKTLQTSTDASDAKYAALSRIVGNDPLPYDLANVATIEALELAAAKQKLTPCRMALSDIFIDPEKAQ